MMKQALSIEIGGFRSHEVFNEFYAQDLIVFGMSNNISEAVRLGEHMLGELGATMSFDMAKAVKSWKIDNNAKYMDAIKRTGPINTHSVYMDNRKEDSNSFGEHSIVNMDDPYWVEYYRKNYRSQDFYKLPSVYAWDYKEHGIMGEIIDMKKLEEVVSRDGDYMKTM